MSSIPARMPSVTSAEFVRHFGIWQDRAAMDPVLVTHHGRARLVLMATNRYQTLVSAEAGGGDPEIALQFATLVDRLDAPFLALDRQRRIVLLNAEAAGYLKLRRDFAIGRHADDAVPDLARSIANDHLDRALASGASAVFDAPSLIYPGELLRCTVFPFGEGAAMIFRTVTIERALRQTGEARDSLAQALAGHGRIGVATLTGRGRLANVDAAFAALAGRTREMLEDVRLANLFAPGYGTEGDMAAALAEGGACALECRIVAPDGSERQMRLALAPLGGEDGGDGATLVMTPSG